MEETEIALRAAEQFLDTSGPLGAIGDTAEAQLSELEASILAKAFRGELVPQDPNDEPASVLLERIRAVLIVRCAITGQSPSENPTLRARCSAVERQEADSEDRRHARLVAHDLRATHVTLARLRDEPDEMIMRRTGHTQKNTLDRYDHAFGEMKELQTQGKTFKLGPLCDAIPELTEMEPSEESLSRSS